MKGQNGHNGPHARHDHCGPGYSFSACKRHDDARKLRNDDFQLWPEIQSHRRLKTAMEAQRTRLRSWHVQMAVGQIVNPQ